MRENKIELVTAALVWEKPRLVFRAIWAYLRNRFSKSGVFTSVSFASTYDCNFRCSHCYATKFRKTDRQPLTLKEKLAVIRECLDNGAIAFDFVGGEIGRSSEFEALVKACEPRRTFIGLATNAYGYTREQLERWREIGVDKLTVSLDSWDAATHDSIRNQQGSWAECIKTIAICKMIGIQPAISVLVTRDSTKSDGFKKLITYAVSNRVQVVFATATPLGQLEANYDSMISEDDRKEMERLHSEHPFLTRDNYMNMGRKGCPAVKQWFQITEYGDVMPCAFCHISLGNLREESLSSIRRRALAVDWFAQYQDRCLACESKEFVEKYLSKNYVTSSYPVRAETLFPEMGNLRPERRNISKVDTVCPVCGGWIYQVVTHGRDHEFSTTTDDIWRVIRCTKCEMVFLSPRPTISEFDTIYPPNYYCHAGRKIGRVQRWFTDRIGPPRMVRELLKLLNVRGRIKVLDIGCGTGAALDVFRRERKDVETYGLDVDRDAARLARGKGHEIRIAFFEDWYFPKSSFDIVYSSHVIEHVAEPSVFMAKVAAILRPGGYFLCETPNYDSIDVRLFGSCWGGYHFPRHWHFFTPRHLNALAEKNGLEVVSIRFCPSLFCWLFSLHAVAARLFGKSSADILVPLLHDNAYTFVLKGALTIFDMIMMLVVRRTSMMSIVYRKLEE